MLGSRKKAGVLNLPLPRKLKVFLLSPDERAEGHPGERPPITNEKEDSVEAIKPLSTTYITQIKFPSR